MYSLVLTYLVIYILHFLPVMKTLKIVFIFTEIVVKKNRKKSVDLCFLYLSVAMMGGCSYASDSLQDKDLILSRLNSLFFSKPILNKFLYIERCAANLPRNFPL